MRSAELYYHFYVVPKDICAAVGLEPLARLDALLTDIRKEQLQAIELVESSTEYFAVLTADRFMEAKRSRTEGPRRGYPAACAREIDVMPRMYQHHKEDKIFEYWIELFSKSALIAR